MFYREKLLLIIVTLTCTTLLSKSTADDLDTSKVKNFINVVQQRHRMSQFTRKVERNFSNPCYGEIFQFITSLKQMEMWTLKMIDASSKIQSGFFIGNIVDLGMYDECLSVNENINGSKIRGRHCMYSISTKMELLKPVLSICVPSLCNATDINRLLNLIIFNMTDIHQVGIKSVSTTCSKIDSQDWSRGSIIAALLTVIYILFLMGCTLLEFLHMKLNLEDKFVRFLSKFSLRRSALKILSTHVNPHSFPALNGIRVLSIFWVLLGHAYAARLGTAVNKLEALEWFNAWDGIYVNLAPFSVDSFFTISGFLMAYFFLKNLSNGGEFNIFKYYLHRYLRLTPAVGMLLVLTIFIVPYVGSGPLRESYETYNNCNECWWTILLYLQNFINKDIMCLAHLWYLAVDMQLFWFSPIILYPLAKKPKIGLMILFASFIATIVTTGIIIATNEYSYNLLAPKNMEMFEAVYKVPYTRAGSWLVGILFGYLLASKDIRLSKKLEVVGWNGAVVCFLFCTLGVRYCQRKEYKYNIVWETIFGSIARSVWSLGLSWIIFISARGRGGLIAKFLSLSIFLPLAKLSYCIYLVHMTLQLLIESTSRANIHFSDIEFISKSFSDLVFSIPLAFCFSLLFESPILILENLIFGRKKKSGTEIQIQNGVTREG